MRCLNEITTRKVFRHISDYYQNSDDPEDVKIKRIRNFSKRLDLSKRVKDNPFHSIKNAWSYASSKTSGKALAIGIRNIFNKSTEEIAKTNPKLAKKLIKILLPTQAALAVGTVCPLPGSLELTAIISMAPRGITPAIKNIIKGVNAVKRYNEKIKQSNQKS